MKPKSEAGPGRSAPVFSGIKPFLMFCVGVLFIFWGNCSAHSTEKKFIQVFFPSGKVISAELAASEDARMRGLMFRKRLDDNQGMLFVFEEEGYHSFWMKNMSISIDILWLDRQKRIVHIEHRVPPCSREPCPSYPPEFPSLYVLELKAGESEAQNLQLFDRLEFVLESSTADLS